MIRILIADDHLIVRKGLKQLIEEAPDLVVKGEAGSGQEVLNKLRTNHYDVLLLDISMPSGNGLDILKHVKAERPDLPVLMLSMYPEELYAVRALRMGASGYLTKESAPDELIKAIQKVSKGKRYLSPSLSKKIATSTKRTPEPAE